MARRIYTRQLGKEQEDICDLWWTCARSVGTFQPTIPSGEKTGERNFARHNYTAPPWTNFTSRSVFHRARTYQPRVWFRLFCACLPIPWSDAAKRLQRREGSYYADLESRLHQVEVNMPTLNPPWGTSLGKISRSHSRLIRVMAFRAISNSAMRP